MPQTNATTPDEDELTEIVQTDIHRVDGVHSASNGMPFLLLKSDGSEQPVDEALVAKADSSSSSDSSTVDCPTCGGSGTILEGNRQCPDCGGDGKVTPAEASDLKKAAASGQLSTADINNLPDSAFAYIEPGGTKDSSGKTTPRSLRHYPVQDKAHADNAAARAAQGINAGGDAAAIAKKAMPKIQAAQEKFGEKPQSGTATKAEADATEGAVVKDLEVDVEVIKTPPGGLAGQDDGVELPTPIFDGAGEVQLAGDEAQHNVPLNNAITSIKTLMTQEVAEPEDETYDVRQLTCILQLLYAWAADEQWEGEDDVIDDALSGANTTAPTSTAPVQKARSHAALQSALAALQQQLGGITDPAAPAAAEKETPVSEDVTKVEGAQPEPTEDVTKAAETAPAAPAPEAAAPATEAATEPVQKATEPEAQPETPAEQPTVEAVAKAAADLLGDVVKAQLAEALEGAVTKAVEGAVKPLEDRLETVEKQPMPGGPVMNGVGMNSSEFLVVQKGQGYEQVARTPDALLKALGEVSNPKDRERISQVLAQNAHPFAPRPDAEQG